MKTNKYEIDMCHGSIMDKLVSFALPLMLSGILQLMFNAVDIIVVGRFGGSQSLAAVGSTTALIAVFTNLFIGISLGANVLAARFYAVGRSQEMSDTVHTAILFALLSGVFMAFTGQVLARPALEVLGTPEDVIGLSVLYMRIYFLGMPFFMLYNYGAAILRAVGDTKRPLLFLIISGVTNAVLNVILVVYAHLDVAGVAIATVISQLISCALVLTCLMRSESSYRLHPSRLKIRTDYLMQIFQVGVPAGIQSTVINLSNALLQSSVNSFGSTAMAGYTAANNILSFMYVSVNSVTQACMSFTSQNYSVREFKRMDRVLEDCLILTVITAGVMGTLAYVFGPQILGVYSRGNPVWNGNSVHFYGSVFSVRNHGSVSGISAGYGTFRCTDDPVGAGNSRNQTSLDFLHFPAAPVFVCIVYFLSGILVYHHCDAGALLLLCKEKGTGSGSAGEVVWNGKTHIRVWI